MGGGKTGTAIPGPVALAGAREPLTLRPGVSLGSCPFALPGTPRPWGIVGVQDERGAEVAVPASQQVEVAARTAVTV